MKNILLTGGAGYIGSHTLVKLIESNYNCIVIDNFSNSSKSILKKIFSITNKKFIFYKGDILNKNLLKKIFIKHKIDIVMHFAGLKSVGESKNNPLKYYENNVGGTINLIQFVKNFNVKYFIFSSSATVYGNSNSICYKENSPLKPFNVYGQTKAMVEQIITDYFSFNKKKFSVAILRYFNPVGAHKSGLIGENPKGVPNNLMPYIAKVAKGKLTSVPIFGKDYSTLDGTGKRDYIHIDDLASGHLMALDYILKKNTLLILNLGTGKPYSVLEVVNCFETVIKKKIPYHFLKRREGDLEVYYADPSLAKKLLGWVAKHNLKKMCEDTWKFQLNCK